MRIECGPLGYSFATQGDDLQVILFDQPDSAERGSVGASIKKRLTQKKIVASPRAWDFLSLALAACTADLAGQREGSADGWTRDFDLTVAVAEPDFWTAHQALIAKSLSFLTTDRWRLQFVPGGFQPVLPASPKMNSDDSVMLLSGGLDSLVGAIDLISQGKRPMAVSQVVRGDHKKQREFVRRLGLNHLLLNHVATPADITRARSQRARSLVFIAYGVLAATSLERHREGESVTLYVCENGFIAINPPLTNARLGSLSTRTTHPVFLNQLQELLDLGDFRVKLDNPYRMHTKGEMLRACRNQELLKELAASSTSCSKYLHFGYKHCGRCVPCQIRRAAFLAWGETDTTTYIYSELGRNDEEHSGYDDVRSAAMAVIAVQEDGLSQWAGNALSSSLINDYLTLEETVGRGLMELSALHQAFSIR